jgi:hypothetical protein
MSDEKRGRGQPPHKPTDKTRQMVQVLKANGNTHKVIAMVMGIDEKTMMKHYRAELDNGFDQVKSMVGAALVKASLGGNIGAIRYWLACRGGPEWKQKTDEDGGTTTGGATIVIRGGIASVHHEPSDEGA